MCEGADVSTIEQVVLLDDSGAEIGVALKSAVHSEETPLHLAFSSYVFNDSGEILLTRRALSKLTWPGVWTNSACGHPAPGESLEAAVERRAQQELRAEVRDVEVVLPEFRYRAVDASGIVENEVCPVYLATLVGDFHPHPDEVAEWAWVHPQQLVRAVTDTPFAFSPWMVLQIPLLLESAPGRFGALR